jgi:1-pyrroline-5-carboxylate dehydrogenase
MTMSVFETPVPVNEPIRSYAPGTPERASLKARLASLSAEPVDVPLVIGGREIRTGDVAEIRAPHDRSRVLGRSRQRRRRAVTGRRCRGRRGRPCC